MAIVNRRDSILEAAAREFALVGLAGGRIERIAASACVNKQLIFHYFRSKNGLYSAVVLAAVSRSRFPPGPHASPPDALRATIQSISQSLESDQMLVAAIVDGAVRAGVPDDARVAVSGWVAESTRKIAEIVTEGQRQGYFRDDIWPGTVAEVVVNESVGCAIRRVVHGSAVSAETAELSGIKTPVYDWVVDYCAWR